MILSTAMILLVTSAYALNELTKSRSFQFFGGIVSEVDTSEKVVALTFDDGPTEYTDEILEILRDKDVKATFYLTGQEIEEYFDEAVKIVDEGHEIGNHSYSHERMVFKSPGFIKDEIEKTDEWIRAAGYEGDIHFRPPYGRKLVVLPHYLNKHERKTVLWNIEPESSSDIASSPNKMIEHAVENVRPGSIILMHVMYESRRSSMDSIEGMITALEDEGYTFTTVSELLAYEED